MIDEVKFDVHLLFIAISCYLRYLVLDEADRLLTPNSGFERDVATLLTETTPDQCQKLLFRAIAPIKVVDSAKGRFEQG